MYNNVTLTMAMGIRKLFILIFQWNENQWDQKKKRNNGNVRMNANRFNGIVACYRHYDDLQKTIWNFHKIMYRRKFMLFLLSRVNFITVSSYWKLYLKWILSFKGVVFPTKPKKRKTLLFFFFKNISFRIFSYFFCRGNISRRGFY